MHFLHCPPGPMGHSCRTSSVGGSGGSGGSGVRGYYYYTDDVSGTSAASTGGGNDGSSGGGGWWNWGGNSDGGNGTGESKYEQDTSSSVAMTDRSVNGWAWFCGLMALTAMGVIAVVVFRKSKNIQKNCHPLHGSVNRRKNLFENVFNRRARELRPENSPTGDFRRLEEE